MSENPKLEPSHVEGELVEDSAEKPRRRNTPKPKLQITRWLLLTAYSPLQVVQTTNYLRYGPEGVRQFGPGAPTEPPPRPHAIQITLTFKQAGDKILLSYEDLLLTPPDAAAPFNLEGTNLWIGKYDQAHLKIWWVWDFYRLFSGLRLLVDLPPEEARQSRAWSTAANTIRNLTAGDQIIIEAKSKSSPILQVYPVDRMAIETAQEP
jgi:hypothetical protein